MTRPRLFPDRPKGTRARERNAAMVVMYQAGHIAEEIGQAHGLSARRVIQILEACGITRRPRNTPSVTGSKRPKKYQKRKHQGFKNKSERYDPDGERGSTAPTQKLYACPGCGTRATNPFGHAQCIPRWTTDAA